MRLHFTFCLLPFTLLVLTACSATPSTPAAEASPPAIAEQPNQIIVDATVYPLQQSLLHFEISGTVAEILVAEGDSVATGDPLARLDSRDLELAVEQARSALGEAQAAYAQLEAGATPEAIAAAEARRDQAAAQLAQTEGSVTSSDIAAAQAQLRQAEEYLARLQRGTDPEPIAAVQAQVAQAQANLASQRNALSAAKTAAESQLAQVANNLRNAQDAYSTIYWDNRELEKYPGDLPQAVKDQEAAALRAVENAEEAMSQAQAALDQARQAETSGIQAAEAQLAEAQANLDNLQAATDPDQIAAAEAQIAAAKANLARLRGPERAGQLAAADAGLQAAQASLDQVRAPTRDVDLDLALARISSAEVGLAQAERALEKTTLRAPFAGIIGEVNLDLGTNVGPGGQVAVIIADVSAWKIETDNLTERDVVKLTIGDPATISFDALPELSLNGKISAIKPLGKDSYGDITYTVTVAPDTWDPRLRPAMSATVTITP
jgi:HlyD family secretion protein